MQSRLFVKKLRKIVVIGNGVVAKINALP